MQPLFAQTSLINVCTDFCNLFNYVSVFMPLFESVLLSLHQMINTSHKGTTVKQRKERCIDKGLVCVCVLGGGEGGGGEYVSGFAPLIAGPRLCTSVHHTQIHSWGAGNPGQFWKFRLPPCSQPGVQRLDQEADGVQVKKMGGGVFVVLCMCSYVFGYCFG